MNEDLHDCSYQRDLLMVILDILDLFQDRDIAQEDIMMLLIEMESELKELIEPKKKKGKK